MIYLAIPYTHEDPAVMDARAAVADHVAALLTDIGYQVYSPISGWHHIAKKYSLPTDHEYWTRLNHRMMLNSDRVLVIMLYGWKESKGVQDEIAFAERFGIEVKYDVAPKDGGEMND